MENEYNTAIATANKNDLAIQQDIPLNREMLEIVKEAQKLEAEIDALALETTSPSEMVVLCNQGLVFDVVDCFITEIRDKDELKDVVLFRVVAQESKQEFSVMQSLNPIRQRYAEYFATFKALGSATGKGSPILVGYVFLNDKKYAKMGNEAIVLKRAKITLPTATAKTK